MDSTDCRHGGQGPAARRIQDVANNRLGAVYSALCNFWSARDAAVAAGQRALGAQRRSDTVYFALYNLYLLSRRGASATRNKDAVFTRRDSYSVVLFNTLPQTVLLNDVTSSPDQLLGIMLRNLPAGGTDFANALRTAQDVMVGNWSEERFVA
jgi:hypothetical protein